MRALIVRLSALGDVVHCWPLADALGRAGAIVAWAAEERYLPLVATHPAVATAIPLATRRWRHAPFSAATRAEVVAATRALRDFGAEVAIDPQGLLKSAACVQLCGAPHRLGFARADRRELLAGLAYTATVAKGPHHVVDRALALLGPLDVPFETGAAPDGRFLLRRPLPAARSDAVIGILPATAGPGKAWPVECYAELAGRLHAYGMTTLLIWGPGERALCERIAAASPTALLAPETSLADLPELLAGCSAVVGGDTGPVHLAAALGVPTVAVFLASDPARNGPRGLNVEVVSGARGHSRRRARVGRGEVSVPEVHRAVTTVLRRRDMVSM